MKKLTFLIFAYAFFSSCDTKEKEKQTVAVDSALVVINSIDSASMKSDSHYFWVSELDQKNGLVMKRTNPIPADSLSANLMLDKFNVMYPEIQLKYVRVSNDTIFLKINKSNYLAEQMGTSGAESYLAEVTFNFTELTGINAVDIRFKAGDHATPDTYTRTDFVNEAHK